MTFNFTEISSVYINDTIDIKTYSIENHFQDNLNNYLKDKVKRIKPISNIRNLSSPFLKESFINTLEKSLSHKKIAHFDKRREFVTEFMAQTLLEKEKNIVFFDEVDKRINVNPGNIGKSTDGIDVPGLLLGSNNKFIVCEVKASDQNVNKVSSSTQLLEEIEKASDNANGRLVSELFDHMMRLDDIEKDNEEIVTFLGDIISNIEADDTKEHIIKKNIIFIPFLIRKKMEDIEDFMDIVTYDKLLDKNINGVIWGFNDNITDFCKDIFDKAVEEVQQQ